MCGYLVWSYEADSASFVLYRHFAALLRQSPELRTHQGLGGNGQQFSADGCDITCARLASSMPDHFDAHLHDFGSTR